MKHEITPNKYLLSNPFFREGVSPDFFKIIFTNSFRIFCFSSHIVPNYCSKGKTLLIWSKAMLAISDSVSF